MKIAVAAAMTEELSFMREKVAFHEIFQQGTVTIEVGVIGAQEIYLLESGIGKVNASMAATLLAEKVRPELVINIGSAGGLGANVKIGDVVLGNVLTYSDVDATGFDYVLGQVPQMPANYPVAKNLATFITEIAKSQPTTYQIHIGEIVTSDSFMSDVKRVAEVKQNFPKALASDMESTAFAQVFASYGIDFLAIRSISDIAGVDAAESFDNHLDLAANHSTEVLAQILTKKL